MGAHPLSPGLSAVPASLQFPARGPSPAGPQSWGDWPRARFTEEGADSKRENKAGGGPGALKISPSDAGLALPNTGVQSGKRGDCRLLSEPPADLTPPSRFQVERWFLHPCGKRNARADRAGELLSGRRGLGKGPEPAGSWAATPLPPSAGAARATELDPCQKRQKRTQNSRCRRWK